MPRPLVAINPKDRHVVGSALLGEATILTTNDSKLRQEIGETLSTLTPLSLDDFGVYLWRRSPDAVSAVVDHLVAKRTKPPVTRGALLTSLANVMPSTARQVHRTRPS